MRVSKCASVIVSIDSRSESYGQYNKLKIFSHEALF